MRQSMRGGRHLARLASACAPPCTDPHRTARRREDDDSAAARPRSERAAHLESDSFFHFIRAGYIEPWKPESHEQNTIVMRIIATAAAGYADAGYFTIIDGIVSPRWFFESLRDALQAAGHEVAYVVLRAPLATCRSRAASRERSWLADAAVIV
jgi:hypothetical protein